MSFGDDAPQPAGGAQSTIDILPVWGEGRLNEAHVGIFGIYPFNPVPNEEYVCRNGALDSLGSFLCLQVEKKWVGNNATALRDSIPSQPPRIKPPSINELTQRIIWRCEDSRWRAGGMALMITDWDGGPSNFTSLSSYTHIRLILTQRQMVVVQSTKR
jgi:hypothetical protein